MPNARPLYFVPLLLLAAATVQSSAKASAVNQHVAQFRCPVVDHNEQRLIEGVITGSYEERHSDEDWVVTWFEVASSSSEPSTHVAIPGGWLDNERFLLVTGHRLLSKGDQVLLLGQRTPGGGYRMVDGTTSFFVADHDEPSYARPWSTRAHGEPLGSETPSSALSRWLADSRQPALAELTSGVREKCRVTTARTPANDGASPTTDTASVTP